MNQKQKIIDFYSDKKSIDSFNDNNSVIYPYQKYRHNIEIAFLKKIIKKEKKDQLKILDVACGSGRFLPITFDNNKKISYIGIDTSKEMLKKIKNKKFYIKNKKDITLIHGDASKLPFNDNSFDIVYTFHFLWHIPQKDQIKIIPELLRVVKDNGVLLIDITNKNFLWRKIKDIFMGTKNKHTPNVYKFKVSEIKKILKKENMEIEKVTPFPIENDKIYPLLNIFNDIRKILPTNFYHMLYLAIRK